MNILEDQVTDLNYLAESPISLPGIVMDGGRNSSSAESPPKQDEGGSKNRKIDEPSNNNGSLNLSHTRAKRNRYISIACNECKRRKIKCNGETPCLRCGNLNLECQYAPNCCSGGFKDSEEFRQMTAHINSLQEQVDNLYANLNSLRPSIGQQHDGGELAVPGLTPSHVSMSQQGPLPPISPLARYRPSPKHPSFRGPTSSAFNLDVAKNTLHRMGYQSMGDEGMLTQDATPVASPPVYQMSQVSSTTGIKSRDPIWKFGKDEIIRLCRVYEEEIGLMYPVVDIEQVIVHGKNLYEFIGSALRTGLANVASPQGINDVDSCILKLVISAASIAENNGQSEIGTQLFESVRGTADGMLHSETIEVRNLPLLVLVAIYHFHCDEEGLAWRIIGQVARMSIELGLHRRDSLLKVVPDDQERAAVVRLFWSIYVLDRRWSFGTGMPFAMQDADIDPNLPEPSVETDPYLCSMISYSRIGSKVWRSISSFSPISGTSFNIDEVGYLDYQILQWQKTIPAELQLPPSTESNNTSRAIQRLQVLLYLRANQMRILIYRPVLHSASSIQENINHANVVVELAKDTIRALTHLNQTTTIYRSQQVCFNYFLVSALAVIFLASCHAPVHFSSLCRSEFYMALDLVKGFSNKSWVSKRLWRTIKGLKEVGPKLGLSPDVIGNGGASNGIEDPHSSAALAMAGLAGHEISGLSSFGGQDNSINPGNENSPMNGFQMSYEMTNLFEAALGNIGMNTNGVNGSYSTIQDGDGLAGVGSNVFGGDEELYRQLKDLF